MSLRLLGGSKLRLLNKPSLAGKTSGMVSDIAKRTALFPVAPPPIQPGTISNIQRARTISKKRIEDAFKLGLLHPETFTGQVLKPEEISRTTGLSFADILKETYPSLKKAPKKEIPIGRYGLKGTLKQFPIEMAGTLLETGLDPESWAMWYGLQKGLPVAGREIFKRLSPKLQKTLTTPLRRPPNLNKLSNEQLWTNFKGNIGQLRTQITPQRFSTFFNWMQKNVQPFKPTIRGLLPAPKQVGKPTLFYGGGPSTKQILSIAKKYNIRLTPQQIQSIARGVYTGLPAQVIRAIEGMKPPTVIPKFTSSDKAFAFGEANYNNPVVLDKLKKLETQTHQKFEKIANIPSEKKTAEEWEQAQVLAYEKQFYTEALRGAEGIRKGKRVLRPEEEARKIAKPPITPPTAIPPTPPVAPLATKQQKAMAHIIAQKKGYISEKGKMKPQYRRLALQMTGKKSMAAMTEGEARNFINALGRLPEPVMKFGKVMPPSIPTTKKLTPQGFFEKKFKEPTFFKVFTPQTYYAQKLGVKPLVEPLEMAKQEFDLTFRSYSNDVTKVIDKIDKLGKTTFNEKAQAKLRNIPTRAVARMRNLLNTYEEAPPFLSQEEKDIFNYFRDLNRSIRNMENKVRESLDLNPIPYRKAYVRHTANAMAKEMLEGRYPFPEGLKYWSQQVVGQRVFNPMEMQRKLANDLEGLWTRDLAQATKSMLWTGLKEIHLSQPLQFFKEQLGAVSKDPAYYKHLTPQEQEVVKAQQTMPASTKKWLIDYVNTVIKGQETYFDESINKVITNSGLKGILNKVLAPFGRTVGRKPLTHLFQFTGRLTIHGVMGGVRPKQLIRNKFQTVQNLALYTLKSNLKAFLPATDKMKQLMTNSLFLKTYSGFEELPTNAMALLEKVSLAPFQLSALSNVKRAMKTAYWDTLDLIENPKYKDLGWRDPKRTYKESKEFLYPSEQAKMLKEMEFGANVTQYHYIPMGMPEMFRYKALVPFTRLQSWWMNYFFKFNREAISRAFTGETGYGAKLPWSRRIGYLRYLILGGLILNTMGYEKSFLLGAAPTGMPPVASLMLGLYNYVTADEDTAWGKRKKGEAKYQIINSLKTFIPGYMSIKDIIAVWEGRKDLKSLFFYTKIQNRKFIRQPFERERFKRQPFKREGLRLLR